MYINNYNTNAKHFAYDGCHKIYLLDPDDVNEYKEANELECEIHDIDELPKIWESSCPLKFISTWDLQAIVPQFAEQVAFRNE